MPTKSKAQKKLMQAAAHSKEFSKKVGVPQDVAKEYLEADKKAGKRKLPDKVEPKKSTKPSNETFMTTATLNGSRGFRDH